MAVGENHVPVESKKLIRTKTLTGTKCWDDGVFTVGGRVFMKKKVYI